MSLIHQSSDFKCWDLERHLLGNGGRWGYLERVRHTWCVLPRSHLAHGCLWQLPLSQLPALLQTPSPLQSSHLRLLWQRPSFPSLFQVTRGGFWQNSRFAIFPRMAAFGSICPLQSPCTLSLLRQTSDLGVHHCLVSSEQAFSESKPLAYRKDIKSIENSYSTLSRDTLASAPYTSPVGGPTDMKATHHWLPLG